MSCDSNIFQNGHFLVNLGEVHPPLVEELCAKMRTPTLSVDWHFVGGRCCVLYLGDHSEAVQQFAQYARWYSDVHFEWRKKEYPQWAKDEEEWIKELGFVPTNCKKYIWSAQDCKPAGMIDIGQAINRGKAAESQA